MFSQNKTQIQKIRHDVTNFRPLSEEQKKYLNKSSDNIKKEIFIARALVFSPFIHIFFIKFFANIIF
jgi:ABC-type methionine transport system ATPase subunit